VVLIDEAHRMSDAAWDTFLTPLEQPDLQSIFLFSTNDPAHIPGTIVARCCTVPFHKVDAQSLVFKLRSLADQYHVDYTLDGLNRIAQLSDGRPRDAMNAFQKVAASGDISVESVNRLIEEDLSGQAHAILTAVVQGQLLEAIGAGDRLTHLVGPIKTIEALFAVYAREVFVAGSEIVHSLKAIPIITTFFLKWSQAQHLSTDVVPLLLAELNDLRVNKPEPTLAQVSSGTLSLPAAMPAPQAPAKEIPASIYEMQAIMEGME
jgi:DNA polymerase III gamma/tau subunit